MNKIFGCLLGGLCLVTPLVGENIWIHTPDNDSVLIDVPSKIAVNTLKDELERCFGVEKQDQVIFYQGKMLADYDVLYPKEQEEFWLTDLSSTVQETPLVPKATYHGYRNYFHCVTPDEKKDIRFILKILSEKSIASVWGYKSQLEYAGDRIDHIHPLRFLECVFTDDELKVYIHNIKKRGSWIWGEFIKGLKDSFQEEASIGNLKDEFINDFTSRLSISTSTIDPHVKASRWEEFVKTLIVYIPRDGDSGRYDQ